MKWTASILLCLTPIVFAADPTWRVYETWPFTSDEAAKRQAETAKALEMPERLRIALDDAKDGITLDFRLIPAGVFEMGSPATEAGHEADEKLQKETVASPFYMMETQLTIEGYRALMKADPPAPQAGDNPKLPVRVAYRDAVDKVLPALVRVAPKGWKPILPDRVRLEYAARAGVATMNPGGDKEKDADPFVWYKANSGGAMHPVAQKKPNAWGLYDVIGNQWHWYWAGPGANGDNSKGNHLIYGGSFNTPAAGNGARLANIMVSPNPEGVRYALIRSDVPYPKGHPEGAAK